MSDKRWAHSMREASGQPIGLSERQINSQNELGRVNVSWGRRRAEVASFCISPTLGRRQSHVAVVCCHRNDARSCSKRSAEAAATPESVASVAQARASAGRVFDRSKLREQRALHKAKSRLMRRGFLFSLG